MKKIIYGKDADHDESAWQPTAKINPLLDMTPPTSNN